MRLMPHLDTSRALERFRNQVLLTQWVDRRWHGVRRVMEDMHRMWLIRPGGRLQAKPLAAKRNKVRRIWLLFDMGWVLEMGWVWEMG